MSTFVSQQLFEFMVLLYGGMIAAFIYDLIALYRKHLHPSKFISVIQDILYWIMITSIVIYLLQYSTQGSVKLYCFLALILGFTIYKVVLSKMIQSSIEKCVNILIKIIKLILKILFFPFINIIKFRNTDSKM